MGDTLSKVTIHITDSMFELWDKAQIIVALTRTKIGKNTILVGDKEETIEAIVRLVQRRSQWADYMENTLKFITINKDGEIREPQHYYVWIKILLLIGFMISHYHNARQDLYIS